MASHSQRFLQNDASALLKVPDPRRELQTSLTELVTKYPPKRGYAASECHGLYKGPTGIAYLFLHLNLTLPELQISPSAVPPSPNLPSPSTPKEWCMKYLAGARPTFPVENDYCGVMNETLAHLAISAAATQDITYVRKFLAAVDKPGVMSPGVGSASSGSCEWLYGRAGSLYMLRLMRVLVPATANLNDFDPVVWDMVNAVLDIGKEEDWRWKWHGHAYLGALHGAIGIVTQVALSAEASMPDTPPGARMEKEVIVKPLNKVLEGLLKEQRADGNWPAHLDHPEKDELLQFCHGAPGFVVSLWALVNKGLFPEELLKKDDIIGKAEKAIWERGLLKKEPCLCHGITGNALALRGEQREHFLAHTTEAIVRDWQHERIFGHSSDPWGLYGGLAGRAWGFIVSMREKEGRLGGHSSGGFIGYSDV
jgi:Lanthionine synthetase C-like protein